MSIVHQVSITIVLLYLTWPLHFIVLRILENGIDPNGRRDVRRVHKKNLDVSIDTQYTYMNLFNLMFFEIHTF